MSNITNFLKRVDLFSGLSDVMLNNVAGLCQPQIYNADSIIIRQDTSPDNFYLIQEGTVQIVTATETESPHFSNAALILLGNGQTFGEMGLIDHGPRSATVKAVTDTEVLVIECQPFRELCDADTDLGYKIMQNIAADLSFKLRYRNLI